MRTPAPGDKPNWRYPITFADCDGTRWDRPASPSDARHAQVDKRACFPPQRHEGSVRCEEKELQRKDVAAYKRRNRHSGR